METVLTVSGARKRFGDTQALNGATLTLRRGEWLGLLGPNGAGKTTLVRTIAGRVALQAGHVELLGVDLRQGPARAAGARQRLGLVPQEIALYDVLTARENLEVFGSFHGVRGQTLRERIDWALEWTGLADRADRRIKTYSGGMKRRLNIACGVLHKPEVVLLDEPTVGVDPQSRQRIWEMLDRLRRDGTSLLLTTHQLDEAQKVCERITIIDYGKTIADGSFHELVDQTIGSDRMVTLTLNRPISTDDFRSGVQIDGQRLRCGVQKVAGGLPPLLERVRAAGYEVEDVQVESPSLHNVFLHLTGRELRE